MLFPAILLRKLLRSSTSPAVRAVGEELEPGPGLVTLTEVAQAGARAAAKSPTAQAMLREIVDAKRAFEALDDDDQGKAGR